MKESNPLVSIIIPTYNDVSVVCDAIESALKQTYNNIEVIVVDDGSIDGTGSLLKAKYGEKIKYVFQKNKGLASARNTGLRHAFGKYLQFLDADDIIDPMKISIQMNELCNVSGNALAYCNYIRTFIEDMTIASELWMSPVLQSENPFEDIMMKWETEVSIPIHAFLFAASLFRESGTTFDEDLPTHEDWECWMNLFALSPKVIFVDLPLVNYRLRSVSMCKNPTNLRVGYLMAINKQIQKYLTNKEIIMKLNTRKKQIRFLYRDVSPMSILMDKFNPVIKHLYIKFLPWRIQRMLD